MREVRIAFYLSMIIGYARDLYLKIVPVRQKHTIWFSLPHYRFSIRLYTSTDISLLDRIRDAMKEDKGLFREKSFNH